MEYTIRIFFLLCKITNLTTDISCKNHIFSLKFSDLSSKCGTLCAYLEFWRSSYFLGFKIEANFFSFSSFKPNLVGGKSLVVSNEEL